MPLPRLIPGYKPKPDPEYHKPGFEELRGIWSHLNQPPYTAESMTEAGRLAGQFAKDESADFARSAPAGWAGLPADAAWLWKYGAEPQIFGPEAPFVEQQIFGGGQMRDLPMTRDWMIEQTGGNPESWGSGAGDFVGNPLKMAGAAAGAVAGTFKKIGRGADNVVDLAARKAEAAAEKSKIIDEIKRKVSEQLNDIETTAAMAKLDPDSIHSIGDRFAQSGPDSPRLEILKYDHVLMPEGELSYLVKQTWPDGHTSEVRLNNKNLSYAKKLGGLDSAADLPQLNLSPLDDLPELDELGMPADEFTVKRMQNTLDDRPPVTTFDPATEGLPAITPANLLSPDDLPQTKMPPALPPPNAARSLYEKVEDGTVTANDYWATPPESAIEKRLLEAFDEFSADGNAPKSISGMRDIASTLAGDIGGTKWTKAALTREINQLVTDGRILMPQEPRALEITHRVLSQGPASQPSRASMLKSVYGDTTPPHAGQRGYGETSFKDLGRAADATVEATSKMDEATHAAALTDAWRVLEDTYELKRPVNPKTGKPAGNQTSLLQKNKKMLKSELGYERHGVNEAKPPLLTPDGQGIETTGLSLYQAYEEPRMSICANHASCAPTCLGLTSGGNRAYGGGADPLAMKGPRLNHYLKTQAFIRDPEAFMLVMDDEIGKALIGATKRGNKLGIRFNVLSDVPPATYKKLMDKYPDVTFYDYTKLHGNSSVAPNHHLTYSSTGVSQPDIGVVNPHQNWKHMVKKLDGGHNITMAFTTGKNEALPKFVFDAKSGKTYKVIDGDTHDFRPADDWDKPEGADGYVVGLRNKSQDAADNGIPGVKKTNGFFTHHDASKGDTVTIADQGSNKVVPITLLTLAPAAFFTQYPNWDQYNPELAAELEL